MSTVQNESVPQTAHQTAPAAAPPVYAQSPSGGGQVVMPAPSDQAYYARVAYLHERIDFIERNRTLLFCVGLVCLCTIVLFWLGLIFIGISCFVGDAEIHANESELAKLHNGRLLAGQPVAVAGWVYTEPVLYVRRARNKAAELKRAPRPAKVVAAKAPATATATSGAPVSSRALSV